MRPRCLGSLEFVSEGESGVEKVHDPVWIKLLLHDLSTLKFRFFIPQVKGLDTSNVPKWYFMKD